MRFSSAAAWAGVLFSLTGLCQAADKTQVLFSTEGFWRAHYTLQTPVVGTQRDAKELAHVCKTPPPAKGWQAPDFDDSSWRRLCGPTFPFGGRAETARDYLGAVYSHDSSPCLALICMRGRFVVDNPAEAGDLTLDVRYRGGVAVYLNGKEIARDNLPADAKELDLASPYPKSAFATDDGKLVDSGQATPAVKLRNRELTGVKVPASLLRKGVNVIAVEAHRSPYDAVFPETVTQVRYIRYWIWSTCAIISAELKTAKPVAAVNNISAPAGIEVWNSSPLETDFALDHALAGEQLEPVRIVAPRGGAGSGKLVIGAAADIAGPSAQVSVLTCQTGTRIEPGAVQVRWAMPGRTEATAERRYGQRVSAFDALQDEPPASVAAVAAENGQKFAVQPVWFTVNVPATASAGLYKGSVTLKAGTWSRTVPVELQVCDWTIAKPTQWKTFVELIQSPETVAMQYGLELWSDEHFQRMIPSLELCGQVGSKTLYIPLITQTNLGNTESMVRWKKDAGGYSFDLALMKRYLDLAIKHQGKPDVVVFYVWDVYLEGGFLRYAKEGQYARPEIHNALEELQTKGPRVTTLSAAGKADELQLPQYSEPGDSEAAWKKLFAEITVEMKARGLEKTMALGIPNDAIPTKEVSGFFKRVAPGLPWARHAHGQEKTLDYSLVEAVWAPRFLVYPEVSSLKGWKRSDLFVQFPRNVTDSYPLTTFRLMAEMNVMGSQRGVGRMGADFWPVLKDGRGRMVGTLSNRWPFVDWRNLTIKTTLLAPGPKGALATARFEMLREGVQESEARIFIEQALEGGKLPPALAKRATALLEQRAADILQGLDNHHTCGFEKRNVHAWWNGPGQVGYHWYVSSPWRQSSAELFTLAGEVAKATGKGS